MTLREEMLNLLHTDVAFREEVRRQVLTAEVLALPAIVRELAEAQRRTEVQVQRQGEQIQQLVEQLRHQGEQIQRQGDQIQQLVGQLQHQGGQIQQMVEHLQVLTQSVQGLLSWQRGEAGRRDGERYEQDIVRRAAVLFNGGQGGSPTQPLIQQRLTEQLGALLSRDILPAEADPFLADLVWWKGGQIVVAEVSLQVDGEDIRRAVLRATTLRQAGATTLAVVIGEDWATWEAQHRAQATRVEWKVGAELSEGFLAFRRLSAT